MIPYIQCTEQGAIIANGSIQEGLEHTIDPVEGTAILLGVNAPAGDLYYFDFTTQTVVEIPQKPSEDYLFNYYSKQWEFDVVSADRNAKIKRDKLLAEGPDRINPIWWSSMTFEQQQQWTSYRQALLDITEQINYPEHIVWPNKPA